MIRLNDNLSNVIPCVVYLPTPNNVTISLLNTRSILAKLPDIKLDNYFTSAPSNCEIRSCR